MYCELRLQQKVTGLSNTRYISISKTNKNLIFDFQKKVVFSWIFIWDQVFSVRSFRRHLFRYPNTRPPKFNYNKASWYVYQSYIAEHLPSLDVDAFNIHQAARSFSLFLVEAAKASIALFAPPKPGGPRKRNLQCGNNGGPALWHTDLSRTASDT